jgi:hypothetical protein
VTFCSCLGGHRTRSDAVFCLAWTLTMGARVVPKRAGSAYSSPVSKTLPVLAPDNISPFARLTNG